MENRPFSVTKIAAYMRVTPHDSDAQAGSAAKLGPHLSGRPSLLSGGQGAQLFNRHAELSTNPATAQQGRWGIDRFGHFADFGHTEDNPSTQDALELAVIGGSMSARQFAAAAVLLFFAVVYFFASASSEAETPSTAPVVPAQTSTPDPPPNRSKLTKEQAAEVALSASAIATLIVQTSRQQYYATGHPCACPDDLTRTGRRCGGTSAYSRPGGAAPLCYVSDVPAAMIEKYRSNFLAHN
jgi:hypothetical protein